jgi:hypothetical protein
LDIPHVQLDVAPRVAAAVITGDHRESAARYPSAGRHAGCSVAVEPLTQKEPPMSKAARASTSRSMVTSIALAAAGAPLLAASPALAHDTHFFTDMTWESVNGPAYYGCYASMANSSSNSGAPQAMNYHHFLNCDARSSSCAWSASTTTDCGSSATAQHECCYVNFDAGVSCDLFGCGHEARTYEYGIKYVDVPSDGRGNVCLCMSDPATDHAISDHGCVTLDSKWIDLKKWPARFSHARYETGGCSASELVTNYDDDTYPYWQVTVDDAAAAGGYQVIVSNTYGALVFWKNGNLALHPYWNWDGGYLLSPVWTSKTDGRGHKVEFQTDGNLCIRDANLNILWCSNTYAGGGTTGKKAVDLRIQENCNVTMWAADGTLVWTTDTPFCSSHI